MDTGDQYGSSVSTAIYPSAPAVIIGDGSRWTGVTVGLGGYSFLGSVAAIATDDVWAAGEGMVFPQPNEFQVTYHWDGTKWSNVSKPEEGVLNSISAFSSSDAWAVGDGFVSPGTYALHFSVP